MTERNKWLIGGLGLVALVFLAILGFQKGDEDVDPRNKVSAEDDSDIPLAKRAKSLFDDPEFADAPAPEEDELSQAEKLWPFALERQPNRKEKIKEEWRDFAAKYPKNFYIPKEIRPAMTEAEEKEAKENMETFTALEANFASSISKNKWSEPNGNPPSEPSRPAPAEQKIYFDYKIHELESRIQMIEYWMENNQTAAADKLNAERDLKVWKKELSTLQEVRSQVPKS